MKKYLLTTTAAGAVMALTGAVQAGSYVTVFGGYSSADDHSVNLGTSMGTFGFSGSTLVSSTSRSHSHTVWDHIWTQEIWRFTNTSGTTNTSLDLDMSVDSGFVIGAAGGWDMGNGLSFELEVAYRKHNVDADATWYYSSNWSGTKFSTKHTGRWRHYTTGSLVSVPQSDIGLFITTGPSFTVGTGPFYQATAFTITGSGGTAYSTNETASGDITALSIMANVWYDFGGSGNWHPYIGGGIGWADVEIDLGTFGSASDSGLAYQAGVGIGWDMPNSNNRINLEYRYFAVNDLEFDPSGYDLGYDYQVNEVIVGFRMPF